MARPLKVIDQKDFEKLCVIQCTESEICAWLEVSRTTLDRWCHRTYKMGFEHIHKQKSEMGKISVRRKMYQKACDGDNTMIIWFSKNKMGMSDRIEQKVEAKLEQNITYVSQWGSGKEEG